MARTHALATLGWTDQSSFACFHIRRGDKIDGHKTAKMAHASAGKPGIIVEGENTAPSRYLEVLRQRRSNRQPVFVMTDDYNVIRYTAAADEDIELVTLVQRNETGHREGDFNDKDSKFKTAALRRLLVEVQIAAQADDLVAGNLSNVARFIQLWSKPGQEFVSVDRMAEWNPM